MTTVKAWALVAIDGSGTGTGIVVDCTREFLNVLECGALFVEDIWWRFDHEADKSTHSGPKEIGLHAWEGDIEFYDDARDTQLSVGTWRRASASEAIAYARGHKQGHSKDVDLGNVRGVAEVLRETQGAQPAVEQSLPNLYDVVTFGGKRLRVYEFERSPVNGDLTIRCELVKEQEHG